MSALTAKDIAEWHRYEAKKHQELAKRHSEMAASVELEFVSPSESRAALVAASKNGTQNLPYNSAVTAAELENAVRKKTGRISNLAVRLVTSEDVITKLLHPNSKVYIAQRGWLAVRD